MVGQAINLEPQVHVPTLFLMGCNMTVRQDTSVFIALVLIDTSVSFCGVGSHGGRGGGGWGGWGGEGRPQNSTLVPANADNAKFCIQTY